MRAIALLFFLSSPASAFVPLPAVSSQAVNANFLDLAAEVQRTNIKNGGTITQNLKISSSIFVSGDATFGGAVKTQGSTSLEGPTSARSTFTFQADAIGPQIIQAWAHFVGTGTVVIMDSVGVSSITDIGAGEYRVNFSTPFAGAQFSVQCTVGAVVGGERICARESTENDRSSARILIQNAAGSAADANRVNVWAVGRR